MKFPVEKTRHYGSYLVFGILTTLVNIGAYALFAKYLGMGVTVSTVLAWVVSVLFAFVTNRKFVFHSTQKKIADVFKEIFLFFSSRLFTGALDVAIMNVFAVWLGFDDMLVKIIGNGIVIVLNYVLSKTIVFREKPDAAGSGEEHE